MINESKVLKSTQKYSNAAELSTTKPKRKKGSDHFTLIRFLIISYVFYKTEKNVVTIIHQMKAFHLTMVFLILQKTYETMKNEAIVKR